MEEETTRALLCAKESPLIGAIAPVEREAAEEPPRERETLLRQFLEKVSNNSFR